MPSDNPNSPHYQKSLILPTPSLGARFFTPGPGYDKRKQIVYIVEGPGDAMALYAALSTIKKGKSSKGNRGLVATKLPKASLFSESNILGLPGCTAFSDDLLPLLRGKQVFILFDNDHPRTVQTPSGKSKITEPAAWSAARRLYQRLTSPNNKHNAPRSVSVLCWGGDLAASHSLMQPPGYDLRDHLCVSVAQKLKDEGTSLPESPREATELRLRAFLEILDLIYPAERSGLISKRNRQQKSARVGNIPMNDKANAQENNGENNRKSKGYGANLSPDSEAETGTDAVTDLEGHTLHPIPCGSYKEVITAWRKGFKWGYNLDCTLSVMLACAASTPLIDEQLWIKAIGPPSSGKSVLCEALGLNRRYTVSKSVIRGFLSGWKKGGEDNEDTSLITKLDGMTLLTKDGDTLLHTPNVGQILSEGRDIYDGMTRSDYRNDTSRDYENLRMTWILCGTSSLRQIDESELGQRFLDCTIVDSIDDEMEDDIIWRIANRMNRSVAVSSNGGDTGGGHSHYDEGLSKAMQLTAGYLDYLRENVAALCSGVRFPDDSLYLCTRYAKFVAYMRARPSKRQAEEQQREMAGRLTGQIVRLAKLLAVVLQRSKVDDPVMQRVLKVTLDTARGRTYKIAALLRRTELGCRLKTISQIINETDHNTKLLIRFLRDIGAVESFAKRNPNKSLGAPHYRLTERFTALYDQVVGVPDDAEEIVT